jgi:hypothetical protein
MSLTTRENKSVPDSINAGLLNFTATTKQEIATHESLN